MAKCNQKLCQRTKNIRGNGVCSVCDDVITNVEARHAKLDKNRISKKVEFDLNHMIEINEKLLKGVRIDSHVVSNLVLSGIINIIEQNEIVEELEHKVKQLEHSDITIKARLESIENWVLKQNDSIHQLGDKLSTMDTNGAIVQESNQVKELKVKVSDIETDLKHVKNSYKTENMHGVKENPVPKPRNCKECKKEFKRNCDLELHMKDHNTEKEFNCDVCGKGFFLEWRLRKHREVHQGNIRICHFYKNSKPCPFDDIGCMFDHSDKIDSEIETVDTEESEHEDDEECETIEMHDSTSVGYGENDCHLCDKTFACLDDLCEHFRTCHQEYHQEIQEGASQYHANQNSHQFYKN